MTEKKAPSKRPFIGMHFKCCGVYTRIYLNAKGDAFVGWCPKCSRQARVNVAPGGTRNPFFTAG